jgi:hypothetical protein
MSIGKDMREVRGFTEVAIRGYGDLALEQNEGDGGPESLVIEADERLLPRIGSKVRGGRLVLGFHMPWYEWIAWWFTWIFLPDKSVRYRLRMNRVAGLSISGAGSVTAGRLRTERCELAISGSGEIRLGGLEAGDLRTTVSGSGRLELGGTARRHEIRISGSGHVKAAGLATRETVVRISGSGDVTADVSESLDARISGAGSVRYTGQPRISQRIRGSGLIEHLR